MMTKRLVFLSLFIIFIASCNKNMEYKVINTLRAPAYPLISIDPYTNGWLFGDRLYEHEVNHWTGKEFPLTGAIRVDGEVYRFMGTEYIHTNPIVPMATQESWEGYYVFQEPQPGWEKSGFDDKNWQSGPAAFGVQNFDAGINTVWNTENIWLRRKVILEEDLATKNVVLQYSHDDDVEIYINGIKVVSTGNMYKENAQLRLPEEVLRTLKKGENIIAAHCRNRVGYSLIDFGLGLEDTSVCTFLQTAVQKTVEVLPTQTIYTFTCGTIDLLLTFTAPLLMNDLDLLSRPVNYISYEVSANDSQSHQVEIYLEASYKWALDYPFQKSRSESLDKNNLLYLKTGSQSQSILGKSGDDIRIDWGYFYLVGDKDNTRSWLGDGYAMRTSFCESGKVGPREPAAPDKNNLALSRSLGKVNKPVRGFFMLGYDDIYSIQYFGKNLRPYWNRKGDQNILTVFSQAADEYKKIKNACNKFDQEMMRYAEKCGGKKYAELCALAYRQTVSAHKLVESPDGELLFLSKENLSNGAIATVDVSFPSAPLFLLYNSDLAKGMLNPIFHFCEKGGWNQPFAPHDVGVYPLANGQLSDLYLPVEESANMLILTAAIATMEGNAQYAEKHWETLTQWADYLMNNGFDPANQASTDIFTGPSAHNTNLAVKSILAIASYGRLADMLGKNDISQEYTSQARSIAQEWIKWAYDGDHYRLTFDQPGTWSQKYNLVWDKVMKMNVFPHEVAETEIRYYLTKQNTYGLPLDSRQVYTKADWIVWSATLAPNLDTFKQFIDPLHRFVNETSDRVPMSDWYWTDRPNRVGFQARSVVGGYFIKMMEDKLVNK